MIITATCSTSPHLLSPHHLPSLEQPPSLSLSLSANTSLSPCANSVPLHNPNPNSIEPNSFSMASSGNVTVTKRSSSTGSSTQGLKRARRAFSPANLQISAAALLAPTASMRINFLPPLPIITMPFKFLKSVDLRTIGRI